MKLSDCIHGVECLNDIEDGNLDAWHEYKKRSIGSSEVAVVLGLSPFKTAAQLLEVKRTGIDDFEGNDATWWGTEMEPLIFKKFLADTKMKGMQPKKMYHHPDNELFTCSPDGFLHDAEEPEHFGICEIKNVSHWKREQWEFGAPPYYWMQVQWQLGVMGMQWAFIVGQCGYDTLYHKIYFDEAWFKKARSEATRFLECVESGDDFFPIDIEKAIAKRAGDESVELSEEGDFLCDRYLQLEKQIKELKAPLKPLEAEKAEIKEKLITISNGKNCLLKAENFIATVKVSYTKPYTTKGSWRKSLKVKAV